MHGGVVVLSTTDLEVLRELAHLEVRVLPHVAAARRQLAVEDLDERRLAWNRMERNGTEWNGMEWNGMC